MPPAESPSFSGLLGRGQPGALAGKSGRRRPGAGGSGSPGIIGIGNRGTALLRALLDLPGTSIVAVCDADPKYRQRGQDLVERPAAIDPRRSMTTAEFWISPTSMRSSWRCRATCTEPTYRDADPTAGTLHAESNCRLRPPDRRGREVPTWACMSVSAVEPAVAEAIEVDPAGRDLALIEAWARD